MTTESLAACGLPQDWTGLYRKDYDLATPESNAHPAKGSWDLAFRILDHLRELGLLKDGDTVLDPMCGTARFPIAACAQGLRAIGVELEPKFVAFSEVNRDYASRKLGRPLDLTIIQGDSRHLSELLKERGLITLTSPPYQTSEGISITRRNRQVVAHSWAVTDEEPRDDGYGSTPGQIGAMKDRPLKAILSPPYGWDGYGKGGIDLTKAKELRLDKLVPRPTRHSDQGSELQGYSDDPENIGNLPDKPLKTITSPPYEDSKVRNVTEAIGEAFTRKGRTAHDNLAGYGEAQGQIGRKGEAGSQEDYLSEMKKVYAQIALVSDVLVVVIKNPTRNGKLRRLDLSTIALLEATGWTIRCVHRAILFEEHERQTLFGETELPSGKM